MLPQHPSTLGCAPRRRSVAPPSPVHTLFSTSLRHAPMHSTTRPPTPPRCCTPGHPPGVRQDAESGHRPRGTLLPVVNCPPDNALRRTRVLWGISLLTGLWQITQRVDVQNMGSIGLRRTPVHTENVSSRFESGFARFLIDHRSSTPSSHKSRNILHRARPGGHHIQYSLPTFSLPLIYVLALSSPCA